MQFCSFAASFCSEIFNLHNLTKSIAAVAVAVVVIVIMCTIHKSIVYGLSSLKANEHRKTPHNHYRNEFGSLHSHLHDTQWAEEQPSTPETHIATK